MVGSECEAPYGVLEVMLLDAAADNVVPGTVVLKKIVVFKDIKGKVLSLQELGALGTWVLDWNVLLVFVKGAVEEGGTRDVSAPVMEFEACEVKVRVDVYDSVLVLVILGEDEDSLSEKVGIWLVNELWRVKFIDTMLLVGPG